MSGIAEIIAAGKAPGIIVSDGKTEQRKLEDQSARDILKTCHWLEQRDGSRWTSGMNRDIGPRVIKEVWQSELADQRKNSITERYDDAMARVEEKAAKLDDQ
jgi:hypothetical protein